MRWTWLVVMGCAGAGESDVVPTPSVCEVGCEATIAADCSAGPADLTACEADCEALRTGACAVEYEALLTCGEGEPVTCDGAGIPVVAACAGAQATFVDCLGGS